MDLIIDKNWQSILQDEFNKPYFNELLKFINKEYNDYTCYPKYEEIFNAFNSCSFNELKVVIIGQDPYHGKNQANGLCFSVNTGIKHPPSLKNIFIALHNDVNKDIPEDGNLLSWAKQGVLLLNATLTVREKQAGSHQKKGWEIFTDSVIKKISDSKEDVVFLLWGNFAKKKATLIDQKKHQILFEVHPSPLSAYRGWFETNHFSKTNNYLKSKGKKEIIW